MLRRRQISSSLNSSSHLMRRFHKNYASPAAANPHLRSLFHCLFSSTATAGAGAGEHSGRGGGVKTPLSRRLVHVVLLSLTGGFALSALNDLAIFHGCSSKAIEKASQNQKVIEALGEPIARGPWYDASLAVGHQRHTVSCKFPVSGPKGHAILKIKAVRTGDDTWFSFLRHNEWDILISEALLQNEEKQVSRVILVDNIPQADAKCGDCRSTQPGDPEKK